MAEDSPLRLLASLSRGIDALNERVGRAVAWLALGIVLVQFLVVVMRYVFGVGAIYLQESIVYMHGTMFMLGVGYTLLYNEHVRVDIFYRGASARRRAVVDLLGTIAFLLPVCVLITMYSWPYVAEAWRVREGSIESSGIQGVFLLKTVIHVFSALLALQGISLACKSILRLAGASPPAAPDVDDDGSQGGHASARSDQSPKTLG